MIMMKMIMMKIIMMMIIIDDNENEIENDDN